MVITIQLAPLFGGNTKSLVQMNSNLAKSLPTLSQVSPTRSMHLAAQHPLNLPGSRQQLVGLGRYEMLARLSVDMSDKACQITAGLSRIVDHKVSLHDL